MSKFFRTSNHSYYNYLQKYKSPTILKYQSGQYYNMGRKSAWQNLVYKYAADHVTTEEDHSNAYKTPIFLNNISTRLGTFFFLYAFYILCTTLSLSEGQKAFIETDQDYNDQPHPADDRSYGYEYIYNERRPVQF